MARQEPPYDTVEVTADFRDGLRRALQEEDEEYLSFINPGTAHNDEDYIDEEDKDHDDEDDEDHNQDHDEDYDGDEDYAMHCSDRASDNESVEEVAGSPMDTTPLPAAHAEELPPTTSSLSSLSSMLSLAPLFAPHSMTVAPASFRPEGPDAQMETSAALPGSPLGGASVSGSDMDVGYGSSDYEPMALPVLQTERPSPMTSVAPTAAPSPLVLPNQMLSGTHTRQFTYTLK